MPSRFGQIASLARLRPFDTETEQGRSRERYRRVLLTTGATIGARALQAIFSLLTVPLALHHYGAERYGLWLTVSSFLTILVFVDQGLGAGLVQNIATEEGVGDEAVAREWIAAAFVIVGGFGLAVVVGLAVLYPFVPWADLFRVKSDLAASEAGLAMGALVVGFALSAVLGLVQRVYQGRQAAFVNNAWQVLGSALALAGVFAVTRTGLGIPWLVAVMVGGPALASAASGVVLFGFHSPGLRPSLGHARRERVRSLFRTSSLFLLIQFSMAGTLAVDNIIVAQFFGAAAVPDYAVPARLFYFVQMLVALVPQALWPAYSEAIAKKDVGWAKRAYRRSTQYTLLASVAAALLLLVTGRQLLHLWVGEAVGASPVLMAALGSALVTACVAGNVGYFLSATRMLRAQLLLAAALFLASTIVKVFAAWRWGIAAIPVSLAVCATALFTLPGVWLVRRRRAIEGRPEQGEQADSYPKCRTELGAKPKCDRT